MSSSLSDSTLIERLKRRERLLTTYMTVVDHLSPGELLLDDHSRFALIEVSGIEWMTADADGINWGHGRLNATYRQLASDRIEITLYDCRGHADPAIYPAANFPSALVESIDGAYRDSLFPDLMYDNRLYIGVRVLPEAPAGDVIADWLARNRRERRNSSADVAGDDLSELLEAVCGQLMTELRDYKPRRLGVIRRGRQRFSEIGEALAFAFSGRWRKVPLVAGSMAGRRDHGRLGNVLLPEDVIVGPEAAEIVGNGRSVFVAAAGLREYPSETWPGMFNRMLCVEYCRTIFHSFRFYNKADGMALVLRKQNTAVKADDKAYSQVGALTMLADQLQGNELVMGMHTMTVLAFAGSLRSLTDVITQLTTDLADSGGVVIRERRGLEAALFSILPANAGRYGCRPGPVSSRNFAAMAPLHSFPSGPRRSKRWGEPVAMLRSPAGTPVWLHLHDPDAENGNGNTLVTGRAGSGKTLFVAFVIAMSTRIAGVIALDYKRGWEALFRGMGAPYAILGAGVPYFSVLKGLDDHPEDIEFIIDCLRRCILSDDPTLITDEEGARLDLGVRTVMRLPREERWLADVRAFLGTQMGGAGARLEKWCWGAELGWVIDAPRDIVDLAGDVNAFDITKLMANARARPPAILYMMHRISRRLDGRPLLVPIDEGWQVAQDPTWQKLLFEKARTIRSRGGVLIFITQSPADAARQGVAEALVEQFPTQIHFANRRAQMADYVNGLKRTPREYEIIAELRENEGMALISHEGGSSRVIQLMMKGLDDERAILSIPEHLLRILESVRASVGDDPATLLAEFHRRRKEAASA